jgi:hypothetical protein
MATKKVAQRTRRTKNRAEKRVSEARTREAAARAGVTGVRRIGARELPNEDGESVAVRMERIAAERKILACTVPGSLASKLRRLLGQGHWIDPDAPDPGNSNCMFASFDRVIIRVAAIQIRAIALALGHYVQGESRLSPELVLSNEETAFALAGISMMLDVGSDLADKFRAAQARAVAL